MGAKTLYILGFRESPLNSDEQGNLDQQVQKYAGAWQGDAFQPIDQRNSDFTDIVKTFEEDEARSDGKKIVLYQEINLQDENDKDKVLEAVNELKGILSDVLLESHDENGKLA